MSLWRRIKAAAFTDVGVLLKGFDQEALQRIEQTLLEADFGPLAFDIVEELEQVVRKGLIKTQEDFHGWMVEHISGLFDSHESYARGNLNMGDGSSPAVFLFVGVNGVGKTTQVAKLAHRLIEEGRDVQLVAADTFRAGATEQLSVWAKRLNVPVVIGAQGADPASVVFDGLAAAKARKKNVVLIDTAGRLHTEDNLMAELGKIVRVIKKQQPDAPHETFLVVDGTVGQNAVQQGKSFAKVASPTGIVVTKLDGTAKGGAVATLPREIGAPVRFVGIGEGLTDLEVFDARRFAERILTAQ